MVGFQTRLSFSEQKRVFTYPRSNPLNSRVTASSRNTYISSPG